MAASMDGKALVGVSADQPAGTHPGFRASQALGRLSGAVLALGLIVTASFVTVFVRLFESWRISPHAASHHVSVFGLGLSYPVANAGALIVLCLALLGAVVTGIGLFAIAGELRGAWRLASRLAELNPVSRDGVFVLESERREAFCAGLLRTRIYVTSGALAVLDQPSLHAVLLHEQHHMRRRDPLRLAVARVLGRALFFLPVIRQMGQSQALLAELSADESAISAAGERSGLARAMLSFSHPSAPAGSSGIDAARVDHLLGESPNWRFPVLTFAGAVALLAVIVGVGILAGRAASGSATLEPPFLSTQPCVVMLALIPCAAGVAAVRLGRLAGHRRAADR
jgi:hypothetical protein